MQILLQKLKTLLAEDPGMAGRGHFGHDHYRWLGHASSLIDLWNKAESMNFRVAVNCIASAHDRSGHAATIFATIHRAIFELEEKVRGLPQQAFGPGAVYDFFKALNELVASAKSSLLIVDPYIDITIFDGYLSSMGSGVGARLLVNKCAGNLKPALLKFNAQHATQVEAKQSQTLHDRLIFIDRAECWVLGASIKDAAKKATYLAPLEDSVSALKLGFYESTWASGVAI